MTREVLKLIAMLAMALDHFAMVGLAGELWQVFDAIGRIAFPIFAFQIATGFLHTHSKKRYLLTVGLFALISEIPFNMTHGGMIYPFSQNVMVTFFIALLMLCAMEKWAPLPWTGVGNIVKGLVVSGVFAMVGYLLGFVAFVDYFGPGVVLVIAFYFLLRLPKKAYTKAVQILLMCLSIAYFCDSLGGMYFVWNGMEIQQQMIGLLSIVPIGLYVATGERKMLSGKADTRFKYFGYVFYPAHLLLFVGIVAMTY